MATDRDAATKLRHLLDAHERELDGIAKALHDGPIQHLLACSMATRLKAHDASCIVEAGQPEELAAIARELRAISERLRPPSLGPFGLGAALRALADRCNVENPSVHVEIDVDDWPPGRVLPHAVERVLLRIAQEAIQNALAHAVPTALLLTLRHDTDRILLLIEDNGKGFSIPEDPMVFTGAGRYGLFRLHVWAEAAGAVLSVRSGPAGTVVQASFPPADLPDENAKPDTRPHCR